MKKTLLLSLTVLFLTSCSSAPSMPTASFQTKTGTVPLSIEIADDPSERETGLMYREMMPENQGMFFVFDSEVSLTFWMKNTLIPLDMVFLDSAKKVVHIARDVQPCQADPCPLTSSRSAAKYVIETNAGWTAKNGVSQGDRVEF